VFDRARSRTGIRLGLSTGSNNRSWVKRNRQRRRNDVRVLRSARDRQRTIRMCRKRRPLRESRNRAGRRGLDAVLFRSVPQQRFVYRDGGMSRCGPSASDSTSAVLARPASHRSASDSGLLSTGSATTGDPSKRGAAARSCPLSRSEAREPALTPHTPLFARL